MPTSRAAAFGNVVTFLFERQHPFVNGRIAGVDVAGGAESQVHASDLEQIANLSIGKLLEAIGEKTPACLADNGIIKRPRNGPREIANTAIAVLPHRRLPPSFEVYPG